MLKAKRMETEKLIEVIGLLFTTDSLLILPTSNNLFDEWGSSNIFEGINRINSRFNLTKSIFLLPTEYILLLIVPFSRGNMPFLIVEELSDVSAVLSLK